MSIILVNLHIALRAHNGGKSHLGPQFVADVVKSSNENLGIIGSGGPFRNTKTSHRILVGEAHYGRSHQVDVGFSVNPFSECIHHR